MSEDEKLIRAFGAEAGRAVLEWAEVLGLRLHLDRVITTGKSAARVVVVIEQPLGDYRRKIIVKVCPPDGDQIDREAGRHHAALRYNQPFARKHLVQLAHPPLRVGNGEWVVFQELAGQSLDDLPALSLLIDGVVSGQHGLCTGEQLEVVCRRVVQSVLRWQASNHSAPAITADVPTFMERQLDGRQLPGGSLHDWARDNAPGLLDPATQLILLDGEVLPNPMALVLDPTVSADRKLLPFEGPVHADLHEENILVGVQSLRQAPTRPGQVRIPYRLIDLSRFEPRGLLTYDPVHLLLSMLARHLDELTPSQQHALSRYVVDPDDDANRDRFPPWAGRLVDATIKDAPDWYKGLRREWREQTVLSLVACSLVYVGRRTTVQAHRPWFLRLAAQAVREFLDMGDGEAPSLAGESVVIDLDPGVPMAIEARLAATTSSPTPAPSVGPDDAGPVSADGSAPFGAAVVAPSPGPARLSGRLRNGSAGEDPHRRSLDLALRPLADAFADRLLRHWESVANARRLEFPAPVEIVCELTPHGLGAPLADAVDMGSRIDDRTGIEEGPLSERCGIDGLFAIYCRLLAGRMVINGPDGAGKTGAGIQLVLDILRYRQTLPEEDRARVAVPMILTPHDWDPERQQLKDWIVKRIASDYPKLLTRRRDIDLVARLVEDGHVALVLDGLDDMPERLRTSSLRALDVQHRLRIVVLSRSTEMMRAVAQEHLTSAAAVRLLPVEPGAAADYLERSQVAPAPSAWARVVAHLRDTPDSPVTQALSSPLMLGLVRDNYRDRVDATDELIDAERFATRAAVEGHLLRGVLPAAYRRRPGDAPPRYTLDQAQRWLGFLAQHLDAANTRDLAWWRLPEAMPLWQRFIAYGLATSVFPGLLFGGLGWWLSDKPERGLFAGLVFGVAALFYDAVIVHGKERAHGATARRIGVGYGLASAFGGVATGTLLVGARDGALLGAGVGAGVGTVFGLIMAVIARRLGAGTRPAAAVDRPLQPEASWRQDRRHSLVFAAVLAVAVGVTLALVCALVGEPFRRVGGAVILEVVMMGFFGLMLSRRAKTRITLLCMWFRRKAPLRLMDFLEEARRLDVLRSAGPVYQFRHARLQDVLVGASGTAGTDGADGTDGAEEAGPPREGGGGRWRGRRRPGR